MGGASDSDYVKFIQRLRRGFGKEERCQENSVCTFKICLFVKDFKQSSDWPKGRVYDVDTQEQWATAIPMLLEKERERIGMKRVSFLNMGHMSC